MSTPTRPPSVLRRDSPPPCPPQSPSKEGASPLVKKHRVSNGGTSVVSSGHIPGKWTLARIVQKAH